MPKKERDIIGEVKLSQPIWGGIDAGKEVSVLQVRRPLAGDFLKAMDSGGGEKSGGAARALVASCCQISEEAVDELEVDEFRAVSKILEPYMPAEEGLPAGKPSQT